jgi:hypothetical protein
MKPPISAKAVENNTVTGVCVKENGYDPIVCPECELLVVDFTDLL